RLAVIALVRSHDLTGQRPLRPRTAPRTMFRVDFNTIARGFEFLRLGVQPPSFDEIRNRFGTQYPPILNDPPLRWDTSATIEIGYPDVQQLAFRYLEFFEWLSGVANELLASQPVVTVDHQVHQVFLTREGRDFLRLGRQELYARMQWLTRELERSNY